MAKKKCKHSNKKMLEDLFEELALVYCGDCKKLWVEVSETGNKILIQENSNSI